MIPGLSWRRGARAESAPPAPATDQASPTATVRGVAYTPDELLQFIGELCKAHAESTGRLSPEGVPLFPGPDLQIATHTDDMWMLRLAIRHPVFGLVGTGLDVKAVGELIRRCGVHFSEMGANLDAIAARRQR